MSMDENTQLLEEDFYTFLNISRSATTDEINNAYRRLSLIYHPDKHTDTEKKKWAETIFNKTKRAYEVLSDPHKRAIYDSLGIKGLETEGWEILQRTKTPMEIREEYERLARDREERRLQRSVNPKGQTVVSINATDLFSEYTDYQEGGFAIPNIEVSSISAMQSVEAPLTSRDTVTLSCNLATQNGNGSGSMNVAARRLISDKGWGELEVGVGNGFKSSIKAFRTLSKTIFYSGSGSIHATPRGLNLSYMSNLAFQLDNSSVGYLTYNGGTNSSMTTTIVKDTEKYHGSLSIQFGVPHSFATLSYTRKMLRGELKLRMSFKLGTFGYLVEYGAEKKITKHSNLSATVSLGVPTGVTLRIKLTRGSHIFLFPIQICEDVLMAPIFYATVFPTVSWLIIKAVIIDPINKEKELRERDLNKENNKAKMQEMYREARRTVELMQEIYKRIVSEETKSRGLIILKAIYGKLADGASQHDLSTEDTSNTSPREQIDFMDVTIPLQCLVKSSKLNLHESSKSQLPGFYDVCLGDTKHLTIHYSYREQEYLCTIEDLESLSLPKQKHKLAST